MTKHKLTSNERHALAQCCLRLFACHESWPVAKSLVKKGLAVHENNILTCTDKGKAWLRSQIKRGLTFRKDGEMYVTYAPSDTNPMQWYCLNTQSGMDFLFDTLEVVCLFFEFDYFG